MFNNSDTGTRIVNFNNRTIVINRVDPKSLQFRIYIDGCYNGILELKDEEWQHTPGFSLPKGLFTLLVKRLAVAALVNAGN